MPQELEPIDLFPLELDRNTAPEAIGPAAGRIIQRIDTTFFEGRIRRSAGCTGTQIVPSATNILNCAAIHYRGDKLAYIDGNTAGTIRVTPGDGTVAGTGPLPNENDSTCFGSTFTENFSEEG